MMNAKEVNRTLALAKEIGTPECLQYAQEMLRDFLLDLRETCQIRSRREQNEDYIVLNHGGDAEDFWQKFLYPGETWTQEQMEAYRKDNWCYPNSLYSNYFRIFTQDIRIFNTPSGVVVYDFECLDI